MSDTQQPPYPEGDVVGACVCGSWPGGKCLRCPWRAQAPAEQAVAAPAWQPIETAPNGVSMLMLANADEGWREQGWYDSDRREWWAVNTHWTDAHGGPLHPTHWMPLPAPPGVAAPQALQAQEQPRD